MTFSNPTLICVNRMSNHVASVQPAKGALVSLLSGLSLLVAAPAWSQDVSPSTAGSAIVNSSPSELPRHLRQVEETGHMTLKLRQGNLLRLQRPVANVLVADPSVASVQVPSPNSLFVYGEKVGSTTLYALDESDGIIAAIKVVVEYDLATLVEQIKREVPGADIQIEPSANDSLIVRGKVRTPLQARQVIESAQAYLNSVAASSGGGGGGGGGNSSKVINQLKVEQSAQVNIQVRVVEMSRTMSHELGFDWAAVLSTSRGVVGAMTGGFSNLFMANAGGNAMVGRANPATAPAGGTILNNSFGVVSPTGGISAGGFRTRGNFGLGVLLTAMQGEGMATVLAEPNLTAMSGETAAFAAGGEVPIVIITNNNVQIDYKSYGVILRMTPTLLSSNRISLHIAPEVSELTAEGSVTLEGGSTIPAFTVRRADTTVELASGQSFALAGMLRSNTGQTVQGVPGLRSLPLLGRFFEHEQTERRETELVILVTAYVVDPVSKSDLKVPGQGIPDIDSLVPQQAAAGYLY